VPQVDTLTVNIQIV